VDVEAHVHLLTKETERLKRELARQQALVRLTQRTVGVAPPAPARGSVQKRQTKPRVRALVRARRLRQEAEAEEAGAAATPVGESE
jgi:hypothetical protein